MQKPEVGDGERPGGGEVRDLGACPTDLCDADLSPDGSMLAFSDENGLVLVDTSDGGAVPP